MTEEQVKNIKKKSNKGTNKGTKAKSRPKEPEYRPITIAELGGRDR